MQGQSSVQILLGQMYLLKSCASTKGLLLMLVFGSRETPAAFFCFLELTCQSEHGQSWELDTISSHGSSSPLVIVTSLPSHDPIPFVCHCHPRLFTLASLPVLIPKSALHNHKLIFVSHPHIILQSHFCLSACLAAWLSTPSISLPPFSYSHWRGSKKD